MQRHRRPELMDQPGLDSEEHVRALQGLSRINALSRTAAILGPPILQLARSRGSPTGLFASSTWPRGGGDLPITLARRASKSGINLVVEGCDISPRAVRFAQAKADARGGHVRFFVLDLLAARPSIKLRCNNVLFIPASSRRTGRNSCWAEWRRLPGAWCWSTIWSGTGGATRWPWSAVTCFPALVWCMLTAPCRLLAAFTPGEVLRIAEQAGLRGATLSRHWPQRYLLTWKASR